MNAQHTVQTASTRTLGLQGDSQKFVSEGDKTGGLGQKSASPPAGSRSITLVGVWGPKPPEAEDIYANNIAIMC